MIESLAMPLFLSWGIAAVAVFSFIAVATWSDNRRREREAYYKSESLKKIAEMEGSGASSVLEYMREEDKNAARRRREGIRLGGLVTVAAAIGLMVFLLAIKPDSRVYFVGLIPLLVGATLLAYAYILAPKE